MIDQSKRGYLTSVDILSFLSENNIKISKGDINSLFRYWDGDSDGRLSYSE